jgi:hypothetical protein
VNASVTRLVPLERQPDTAATPTTAAQFDHLNSTSASNTTGNMPAVAIAASQMSSLTCSLMGVLPDCSMHPARRHSIIKVV